MRCIAALLLMVGHGYESPTIIDDLFDLERFPAKPQYVLAPERPLLLYDSGFRNLQFVRRAAGTSGTVHALEKRLARLDVQRGMLLAALKSLRCGVADDSLMSCPLQSHDTRL